MKSSHILTALLCLMVGALVFTGPLATTLAEEKTVEIAGQKYPLKKFDELSDFKSPRRFEKIKDGMKITPEGVPFAYDGPRGHVLVDEYFKIRFPMDKVFAGAKAATKGSKCLSCHKGIELISDTHDFGCIKCHKGNAASEDLEIAHKGILPNPADPRVVSQSCGVSDCHQDQLYRVERSLMSTSAGEIASTRFAWGAQDGLDAVYAATDKAGLKLIPTQAESNELVDDMLRKKCLRCHINSPAPQRAGDYRGTGCAACHMVYSNDGKTMTGDMAIQKTQKANLAEKAKDKKLAADMSGLIGKRGYPMKHRLTVAVPTVQCVRCHSGNRTGTEYIGLFEHDYEKMYRSPRDLGGPPSALYGIDHHTLVPDIHYEKGLACIDCHTATEIMGKGEVFSASHEALETTCSDCHGTVDSAPKTTRIKKDASAVKAVKANPNINYSLKAGDEVVMTSRGTILRNVKKTAKGFVLTSKVTGKQHTIPLIKDSEQKPIPHQVTRMMQNVECSACHAQWLSLDLATHLMREDYKGYKKWARWREPDPNTLRALFEVLGTTVGDKMTLPHLKTKGLGKDMSKWPEPKTLDWISGDMDPGIWYSSMTMRRWEDNILGRNAKGKVSAFRPQYQYFVSHIGPEMGKLRSEEKKLKKALSQAPSMKEKKKLRMQLFKLKKKIKKQVFADNQAPTTKDGRMGLVMNPYTPHTIGAVGRRCEECHTNAEAAGLGRSTYYAAKKEWAPQLDSRRAGMGIDFQIHQAVTPEGDPLQITTQKGARFFNKQEIAFLTGKSRLFRAMRYLDLKENNYLTLLDRDEKKLTGGAKRMVKEGISRGDIRKVGSYYDWRRYGFWQTDPVVFDDDYFRGKKKKKDWSKDPVIVEEKKEIEEGSKTYLKSETTNFNFVPKPKK